MGDALNVAVEEIEDPRVYSKNLEKARVKIGGELIRDIPFWFAPACVTNTIQQIVQGPSPAPLSTSEFDDDRAALKELGKELRKNIEQGETPNPKTVKKRSPSSTQPWQRPTGSCPETRKTVTTPTST